MNCKKCGGLLEETGYDENSRPNEWRGHDQAECLVEAIDRGFQRVVETINHLYSLDVNRREFRRTIDKIDGVS